MTATTRTLPEHGTPARYRHGCRQECCLAADRRERKRRTLFGTVKASPDAVTAKLHQLRAAGASAQSIAEAAGRDRATIERILNGDSRSILTTTRDSILAIDTAEPRASVDATVSIRQVRAMLADGHSSDVVACESGLDRSLVSELVNGRRATVRATTAIAVDEAYGQLRLTQGVSVRSRRRAVREGWPSPAQWADDVYDVGVDPRLVFGGHESGPTPEEFVEEAERLRTLTGDSWDLIADRLKIRKDTLHTYRTRVRERATGNAGSAT